MSDETGYRGARRQQLRGGSPLAALIADMPAMPDALCVAHPGLHDGDDHTLTAVALQMCSECPEMVTCRLWAETHPPVGVIQGGVVWTPEARRARGLGRHHGTQRSAA